MHVKTKIATLMNDIGLLHNQLADKHIALSGIMGQGVEEVAQPVVKTVAAPVVAQVPVTPVMEVPSAPTVNTAPSIPTETPVAPVAVLTPSSTTTEQQSSAELDDEGYPWDERIHASSKAKVKSKLVKGGEAWRIKRGGDPILVEQVRNEYVAENSCVAPVSVDTPSAPQAAPVVPTTPQAAPVVPTTPQAAPVVPEIDHAAIKSKAIETINKLVTDFSVEYDDVLENLRETFKIINFDDLKVEQYQAVADNTQALFDAYLAIHNTVLEIRKMGGDEHVANIEAGLKSIYGTANTDCLGGVHYSQLSDVNTAMIAYRQSWIDAGFKA